MSRNIKYWLVFYDRKIYFVNSVLKDKDYAMSQIVHFLTGRRS